MTGGGAREDAAAGGARRALRLFRGALGLLLLAALLELGLRALYAVRFPESELERRPIAWEGGQLGLEQEAAGELLAPWETLHRLTRYDDPERLWTLAPSQRRRFRFAGGTLDVFTNSEGFHTPEFFREQGEGVFRIVCLGSSFTFLGWPQRLEDLLRWAHPEARFEVLNLAVPGYSSHQVRALAQGFVSTVTYDVAVCAVGGNESLAASVADSERAARTRVRRLAERIELFRLATWLVRSAAGGGASGEAGDAGEAELVPRVSPQELGGNLRAIERALRAGAGEPVLFLVMNPLGGNWEGRFQRVVRETGSAHLDVTAAVAELLGPRGAAEHFTDHPDELGSKAVAAAVYRWLVELPSLRAHLGEEEPVPLDRLWPRGTGGRL